MTDLVQTSIDDGILRITIQRPDKKNALTQDMYAVMADALEGVASDPAIRVVHITGSGDAFTAGNDIGNFEVADDGGELPPVVRFLHALPALEVPLVAAVNGLAIGVGVTLLLHCDFVYASDSAVFTTPFVDLALVPEAASSLLLPLQIGHLNASRLLLLGEKLSAAQALDMGLVSDVVSGEELQQVSLATAAALAAKPPAALRASKRLMRQQPESVLARMDREVEVFAAGLQSPEFAEAMSAFMEKRPADFSRFD